MARISDRERVVAVIALVAALAWQIYVLIRVALQAPTFLTLFEGLGTPLPTVTRAFVATYRYWWLVTALFSALSLDLLRRRELPVAYFATILAFSAATALALDAWLEQAVLGPMIDLMQKIG